MRYFALMLLVVAGCYAEATPKTPAAPPAQEAIQDPGTEDEAGLSFGHFVGKNGWATSEKDLIMANCSLLEQYRQPRWECVAVMKNGSKNVLAHCRKGHGCELLPCSKLDPRLLFNTRCVADL